jgi:hypothetical protein
MTQSRIGQNSRGTVPGPRDGYDFASILPKCQGRGAVLKFSVAWILDRGGGQRLEPDGFPILWNFLLGTSRTGCGKRRQFGHSWRPRTSKTSISAGFPMPNQPESAFERLDAALGQVADALADLTEEQWDGLCEQEARDLLAAHQYFEVSGYPDRFPPERWLGSRILTHLAARHPLVFGEKPAGTA